MTQDSKLSLEDASYDNDNYMISYALHCAALQLMKNDGFEFKYVFDTSTEEKDYNKSYSTMYTAKAALIVRQRGEGSRLVPQGLFPRPNSCPLRGGNEKSYSV